MSVTADVRSQGQGGLRRAGFTLIELLVVLAIIAALMTSVPAVMAGIPGFRFRAAASELAETLRRTRDDAIRVGRVMQLVVRAGREDAAPAEPGTLQLAAGIDVEASGMGQAPPAAIARFRFFADGSASGGMIRLRQGSRSAIVRVDWLTGRVRVDD